jgi:tRNA pseudouridine55 synthase
LNLVLKNNSSGFIFVDKPEGITSSDLCIKLKKKLGISKIGHIGTLDKFASGLMIFPFGKYTNFVSRLIGKSKVYHVVAQFGIFTDSGDPEGTILEEWDNQRIESFLIQNEIILKKHFYSIKEWKVQVPPKISALKIKGKRQSTLFREGVEFESKPRNIEVSQLDLLDWTKNFFTFKIEVSSGTYIRKIVQDLSEIAEIPMYVKSLRRLAIGNYDISNSIDGNSILEGALPKVFGLEEIYPLPVIEVENEISLKILNGTPFPGVFPSGEFFIVNKDRILLAWAESENANQFKYIKVFSDYGEILL